MPKTQYLTRAGVIAALYVVLSVVVQPLGYGAVQLRISEMLTILPVYTSAAIPGLTVGCFLSNLIGLSGGMNPAGVWDLAVGTAATLLAALCTYALRRVRIRSLPIAATVPPVVINALAIGVELTLVYGGLPWYGNVLGVAAGQFLACCVCGSLLAAALNKTKWA